MSHSRQRRPDICWYYLCVPINRRTNLVERLEWNLKHRGVGLAERDHAVGGGTGWSCVNQGQHYGANASFQQIPRLQHLLRALLQKISWIQIIIMVEKRNKTALYRISAAFALNLIGLRTPAWYSWVVLVFQNDTFLGTSGEDEPLNRETDY